MEQVLERRNYYANLVLLLEVQFSFFKKYNLLNFQFLLMRSFFQI